MRFASSSRPRCFVTDCRLMSESCSQELIERLATICVQAVEKLPFSGWVGECFEYLVHRLYSLREYYVQPFGCMSRFESMRKNWKEERGSNLETQWLHVGYRMRCSGDCMRQRDLSEASRVAPG